MKTKKITKKLVLNKKTVADLSVQDMSEVKGGAYTGVSCNTGVICTEPECCEYTYSIPRTACPTMQKICD